MNNTREKSLFKNTFIISIGTICTKLVTFFLLPLYTRLLTTSEYGIVDLLTTLVTILIPIITFQIEQAVFRELIECRGKSNKKHIIIFNSVFIVFVQCIIYSVLFLSISGFIKNDYKIFLFTNVIVAIFSSLLLQIARGLGENKVFSIGSFINAITTIIFNVLFLVVFNMKVNGMLLGTFVGQTISIIYLFITLKIYNSLSLKLFDFSVVRKMWKYSFPLIPNAISWWIFGSSDRVIVSIILGLSMNGILSAASKFSAVFIMLYNIFNMSWTESISLHINDNDLNNYFSKMFNIIFSFFMSFALIIIAIMPFIYTVMIDKEYIFGYNLVPILIVAALFNVIVGLVSVVYIGKKNTKTIANTSIIAALVNILVHFALIKYIGLYSAAISTLAAYFILALYRLYDIKRRYFKVQFDYKNILIQSIALVIVCIIYYFGNSIIQFIALLCSFLFIIIVNKNILKILTQKGRRFLVNGILRIK